MALWSEAGSSQTVTNANASGATTGGITVTASATPHTMGSWTTLVASTAWAVDGLTLFAFATTAASGADTSMLVDIGVGAAASERMLVAGVPIGWAPSGIRTIQLPLRVAAGERIAARIQSAVVSATLSAGLVVAGGGGWLRPSGGVVADAYGVVSASSSGTAIADIGSTHTKSAFTEFTSSTTRRYRFLVPAPTLAAGDSAIQSCNYLYDIAIGGSGSEVVILPNLSAISNAVEEIRQPTLPPFAVNLPAGTRLSARQQKSVAAAEPMSLVIVGID